MFGLKAAFASKGSTDHLAAVIPLAKSVQLLRTIDGYNGDPSYLQIRVLRRPLCVRAAGGTANLEMERNRI